MNQYGIPSAADFQAARVTNPGQAEVIRQRIYDFQLYPAAGSQQLSFFQQPIGSGFTTALGGAAGTAKTSWDTNMNLGGQLPSGQYYLAESIEVLFDPGSVSTANTYTPATVTAFAVAAAVTVPAFLNDVNSFYQGGMLELNVLQKNYLRETPLRSFPPKAGFELSSAISSNSATVGASANANMKAGGRPYFLDPRVSIQPAVNFEVLLKWPAAVACPSTFNGRVGVYIDGFMMRASQ